MEKILEEPFIANLIHNVATPKRLNNRSRLFAVHLNIIKMQAYLPAWFKSTKPYHDKQQKM